MKLWHARRVLALLRWLFFGAAGVGGLLLEILGHRDPALAALGESLPSVEWGVSLFTVVMVGLTGLLLLGEMALDLHERFSRRTERRSYGRYRCRAVKTAELEVVYQFWKAEFGNDVAPLEQMRRWHERHPELFWILHDLSVNDISITLADIVGSFSAIPITRKARSGLERDALTGAGLTANHVVRPNRVPAALYIGGVVALNRRAKAESLAFLEGHLYWYRKNGVTLYARAVRPRGLELLTANVFVPVGIGGLNHIYRLDAATAPAKASRRGRGHRVFKGGDSEA